MTKQIDLLRILCDHEDELEVVHAQSNVVELIDFREKDDILDRILDDVRVISYANFDQYSRIVKSR